MPHTFRLIMAQLNFHVGDITGNAKKIIEATIAARDTHKAQLIVFTELALTGYPPEDLLYRKELYEQIAAVLPAIIAEAKGIDIILGYPESTTQGYYNQAAFIRDQHIIHHYHKQKLPNYSVFDEIRYFQPGATPYIIDIQGVPTAITICEDMWHEEPVRQAKAAGAQLLININASPFAKNKAQTRAHLLSTRARQAQAPIVYVNTVGGQDELVFDGGSMVVDAQGHLVQQADFFREGLFPVDIEVNTDFTIKKQPLPAPLTEEARIYQALVLGVRDYIEKNQFRHAILGLSGGIDSALTLAIAVDAIGKDRVKAILMPSQYTSDISLIDAKIEAERLGVQHSVISIQPIYDTFLSGLAEEFKGLPVDTTEENLQARCRGTLLMAISNKEGGIVLTTGNKSEMSVGYATLYGDMAGGFSVLKDVTKTLVYSLAAYRNQISHVIPQRVIERAPTAELAANQKDQDFLPPYEILDEILERYIELDESIEHIIQAGFDADMVKRVVTMVERNEYKRRQAAPGVRITERAFGKDRRYPITSGFVRGHVN